MTDCTRDCAYRCPADRRRRLEAQPRNHHASTYHELASRAQLNELPPLVEHNQVLAANLARGTRVGSTASAARNRILGESASLVLGKLSSSSRQSVKFEWEHVAAAAGMEVSELQEAVAELVAEAPSSLQLDERGLAWVIDINPASATREAVERVSERLWQRLLALEFQRQRQVDQLWQLLSSAMAGDEDEGREGGGGGGGVDITQLLAEADEVAKAVVLQEAKGGRGGVGSGEETVRALCRSTGRGRVSPEAIERYFLAEEAGVSAAETQVEGLHDAPLQDNRTEHATARGPVGSDSGAFPNVSGLVSEEVGRKGEGGVTGSDSGVVEAHPSSHPSYMEPCPAYGQLRSEVYSLLQALYRAQTLAQQQAAALRESGGGGRGVQRSGQIPIVAASRGCKKPSALQAARMLHALSSPQWPAAWCRYIYTCMYVCMCVCVCVCIHIYIYI